MRLAPLVKKLPGAAAHKMLVPVAPTGEEVISREVGDNTGTLDPSFSFDDHFDVMNTVAWVTGSGHSKVALQFPDSLLPHSKKVANRLGDLCEGAKFFVLADTSYGSCCVDEVAAGHVSADAMVHYGDSCHSKTTRLPIMYVFPKNRVDADGFVKELGEGVDGTKLLSSLVILDTPYAWAQPTLKSKASELEFGAEGLDESGKNVVFVGENSSPYLLQLMMTNNYRNHTFYSFNPLSPGSLRKEGALVNKQLMKRFYMVEKARDADVVGIVAATLGVQDYMGIIKGLQEKIKNAGRKSYLFVVGKLNPAKLANFSEIDVFVVVACPRNTMIESKEYFKPIVTPYEMDLALSSDKEWTGAYEMELTKVLEAMDVGDVADDDDGHISLVDGGRRVVKKEQIVEGGEEQSGAIVRRADGTSMAISVAGALHQNRTFKGLETKIGETEAHLAVDGRSGIARGYTNEQEG